MPAPPRRGRSVESARKRSTPNARPRDILSINRVIFGRYPASTRQNSRSRYLGKRPFHFKNSVVFGRFIETFQKKIFFAIPHGGSCVTVISSEAPARRESLRFTAAMPFRITERFPVIKNAARKDGRRFSRQSLFCRKQVQRIPEQVVKRQPRFFFKLIHQEIRPFIHGIFVAAAFNRGQ